LLAQRTHCSSGVMVPLWAHCLRCAQSCLSLPINLFVVLCWNNTFPAYLLCLLGNTTVTISPSRMCGCILHWTKMKLQIMSSSRWQAADAPSICHLSYHRTVWSRVAHLHVFHLFIIATIFNTEQSWFDWLFFWFKTLTSLLYILLFNAVWYFGFIKSPLQCAIMPS
jgi:hypothetical protein